MEVSVTCKRNLINNLQWDLKEALGSSEMPQEAGNLKSTALGGVFDGAMERFTTFYSSRDSDDIVLFWNLISNGLLSQANLTVDLSDIVNVHDRRTGEPIRLKARVREPKPLRRLQLSCHYKFKPIYSKLILPIIRLAAGVGLLQRKRTVRRRAQSLERTRASCAGMG